MKKIVVEEIEIVVTTKVENALKNFKKLTPAIKKQVKQMQSTMKNIDLSSYEKSIDNAVRTTKRKIANLKKSNINNEIKIKVNNEDVQKKVQQTKKEIDSIHKTTSQSSKFKEFNSIDEAGELDPNFLKIIDKLPLDEIEKVPAKLKEIEPVVEEVKQKLASVKYVKYDTKSIEDFIKQYEQKVEPLRTSAQKEQARNQLANDFSGGFYSNNTQQQPSNETEETSNKTKGWAQALETVKQAINQIKTNLGQAKGKIEQAKNGSNSLKNSFEKVPKAVQSISQNIGKMSKGLKGGLGHVLKYAGALFSIRGIYSLLRGTANAWLSSQDVGAKQLTANIEYMKYAMRKCTCSSYSICY